MGVLPHYWPPDLGVISSFKIEACLNIHMVKCTNLRGIDGWNLTRHIPCHHLSDPDLDYFQNPRKSPHVRAVLLQKAFRKPSIAVSSFLSLLGYNEKRGKAPPSTQNRTVKTVSPLSSQFIVSPWASVSSCKTYIPEATWFLESFWTELTLILCEWERIRRQWSFCTTAFRPTCHWPSGF